MGLGAACFKKEGGVPADEPPLGGERAPLPHMRPSPGPEPLWGCVIMSPPCPRARVCVRRWPQRLTFEAFCSMTSTLLPVNRRQWWWWMPTSGGSTGQREGLGGGDHRWEHTGLGWAAWACASLALGLPASDICEQHRPTLADATPPPPHTTFTRPSVVCSPEGTYRPPFSPNFKD